MKPADIDRFFHELNRQITHSIQVILTGGAAAVLRGSGRATYDIDFEIHFKKPHDNIPDNWDTLQQALAKTGHLTGITPHYDENIDRWNAIPLPTRKNQRYAVFGRVDVLLLDVGLWSIGKLTRYVSSDISDLREILTRKKPPAKALARLWGKALGMSPSSNMQALFRLQVDAFLDAYTKDIWGSEQNSSSLKTLFLTTAQQTRRATMTKNTTKKR
jgi:hypothetical protein